MTLKGRGPGKARRSPSASRQRDAHALELRLREYDILLRCSPDVISRLDQNLRYLYVSPSIQHVTGLPPDAFLGKTNRELGLPAALVDQWDAALYEVFRTGVEARIEFVFPGMNGPRHYEGVLAPELGPGGEVVSVVKISRDITRRRQVEAALQESEARYRMVVEDQTEVISRFRPDGTFTFVNDVYCRFFGKSPQELVGQGWQPVAVRDDLPLIEAELRRLSPATPVVVVENRVVSGRGAIHWMQFVNRGFFGPDGELLEVQSVGRDITDRRQAEERLRVSEAKYRSLVECCGDAVLLTAPDGRVLAANPAACRMYEMTEEEVCRADREGLVDSGDPRLPGYLEARSRAGQMTGRLRHRRKSGALFEAEVSSAIFLDHDGELRTSMVIRDISEQHRLEEAIRISRALLRSALDALSAHIAVLDGNGTILAVNAPWEHFATANGVNPAAVGEGVSYLAVCDRAAGSHAGEARRVARAIRALATGRRDGFRLEYPCHSPDRLRWFAMQATRFTTEDEVRVVVSHEEITARRLAAEERRGFSTRLLRVQEEERRRLARELHDEIGQLLTGLMLSLEMAVKKPAERRLALIAEAGSLAGELLGRVRELSMDLRPSLLDDLGLLPTLEWHVGRFARRTGMAVALEQEGLEGRRFPTEIETVAFRVIQEALTNAARHAPGAPVAVRVAVDADRLCLQVEDRGPGFTVQPGRVGGRSGGLRGMQERVRLVGGRVAIESAAGRGTSIWAEIPLAQTHDGAEGGLP